ncbi:surfactin synthase thioesterase subunit [Fontibacillus solani]|uniref:Surfactin synthase thioesterase subunit n=1 Tax=Fontibacillus solani TaxID=1572857 RepID=A0A7W3SXA4_9BACL|nr:alpha/beta fold hydrolase [Fontibacillus solani]MBA9087960.1 surfactin synthase thioesterase subunit [Fontibacillus solani]
MTRITIFFFPYAGASASVYERWKNLLPPSIQLVNVELPGRGRRFGEPLLTSVEEMVENVQHILLPHLDGSPYALFGHSLGSTIAFEMSRRLCSKGYPPPAHLFVSGRAAPHAIEDENMHLLANEQFLAKIQVLGGTPPQFFENEQLLSLFLPILKSDYMASETYRFNEEQGRLSCDITVFSGLQDGNYDPMEWSKHTSGSCEAFSFEGGHFFIHEHAEQMAEAIHSRLLQRGGIVG